MYLFRIKNPGENIKMIRRRNRRLLSVTVCLFLVAAFGYLEADTTGITTVKNHKISIELFPKKNGFSAQDEMILEHDNEIISFHLNNNFKINWVKVDGKKTRFRFDKSPDNDKQKELTDDNVASNSSLAGVLTIDWKSAGEHKVIVDYKGTIFNLPTTSEFSREYIANQTSGIISEEGTFLSPEAFWYPKGGEQMSLFEVHTKSPAGYETITQGTRLKHEKKGSKLIIVWQNVQPSDVLFLQGGPYEIQEDMIREVKVYTCFFEGDPELASLYLEKSKEYIAMYCDLLGPYPYDKFAVVENFFETGYGMPSWTLLGRTVVRLPFIPDTSLPHEICHNWWGNGVFVDYAYGNWCEGLTVYCADYLLKKKTVPGGDVDYRRQINRDYSSYIKGKNDFPLTEFRTRHNPATRAVGYGKTMMVFHNLERLIGEERFFHCLRQLMTEFKFKRAGWADVLGIFEKDCGILLENFYKIWVERTGAPKLRLQSVWAGKQGDSYSVSFDLIQEGERYDLDVPVLVTCAGGDVRESFKVGNSLESLKIINLESKPLRLEVDPDHHLFRRLYPEEVPPSIAKVFGSEKQLIVLGTQESDEKREEFRVAAEMINKTQTADIKNDTDVTEEGFDGRSIILLGSYSEEAAVARLLGRVKRNVPWQRELAEKDGFGSVVVYDHPGDTELGVMVIKGNRRSDIESIVRKLPHYGKYSYLLFNGDQNVERGIWKVESSPLMFAF